MPHCVRCGPSSPPQGAQTPKNYADICCGQLAGRIKMPYGREVGLGPGHFVLDGNPAPLPKKGGRAPNFRPVSIVAKRSPISATAEHLLGIKYELENVLSFQ